MIFKSFSTEGQDKFVSNLLGPCPSGDSSFGKRGYFLDVGCRHPVYCNNTFALEEELEWGGLLFDINVGPSYRRWMRRRPHSKIYKVDVESERFLHILKAESLPCVDYVSIDVEGASLQALCNLLDAGIQFKVMTIEHNSYLDGINKTGQKGHRQIMRRLLFSEGYHLLFGDVLLGRKGGRSKLFHRKDGSRWRKPVGKPFEDWWVHPNFFNEKVLNKGGSNLYWEECTKRVSDLGI